MGRALQASGWLAIWMLASCGSSREPAPPRSDPGAAGSGSAAPRLVNLVTATPAIIAVSSTVANAAIVPAHLVDGDLGTAWNSRTGELQGAWIGARVPADAHVSMIRMTVGFTRVDPKLGDLFVMNPRIRKVRVLRDGAPIVEQTLDPAVRTLQDIPIDRPGGEYRIEVVEVVPGTKPSWREVSVSELELWGTPGATAPSGAPVVRVGSFDPISPDDCVAAMSATASGETIGTVEVVALTADLAVCRIDHARVRTEHWEGLDGVTEVTLADTTIALAPVTRGRRLAAGEQIVPAINTEIRDIKFPPDSNGFGDMDRKEYTVALAAWQLTATEPALLVDVTERLIGPRLGSTRTTSTLYRASASQLTSALSYESTSSFDHDTHVEHTTRCRLAQTSPLPQGPPPRSLVVTCERTEQPTSPGAGSGVTTIHHTRHTWRDGAYWPAP